MKIAIIFFIISTAIIIQAQLQPVGLQGMNIYSLAQYGDAIYAGTEDGVYWLRPDFSYWQPFGLQGKKIKAVYPHQYGAVGIAITASVLRDSISSTEPLLYCTSDFGATWFPSDSGITRTEVTYLKDINGFPSPVVCGETFAVDSGKIYKRYFNNPGWEKILDLSLTNFNVIAANQQTGDVFVGGIGESIINAPLIAKSEDKGSTWKYFHPDFPGTDACNSILFDNNDTNIVYAGLKNTVIKSVDKGETWKATGLSDTAYYFNALAQGHYTNIIFAGGSTSNNEFGLFKSEDGGNTWQQIVSVLPVIVKGISSLAAVQNFAGDLEDWLYIGTMGDGIYFYNIGIVDEVRNSKNKSDHFYLSQNYPNPFNPTTTISYQISVRSFVTLKVFDVLGNEIKTLVDEYQVPGFHSAFFTLNSSLSSGVYFYQLQAGKFIQRKKMIILK